MAKVELSDGDMYSGQDICSGCIHYAGKDGWPAEHICNFSAKYNGAKDVCYRTGLIADNMAANIT